MAQLVRVLRVIEYVGERHAVEEALDAAISGRKRIGTKVGGTKLTITAATLGEYPDIINEAIDLPISDRGIEAKISEIEARLQDIESHVGMEEGQMT